MLLPQRITVTPKFIFFRSEERSKEESRKAECVGKRKNKTAPNLKLLLCIGLFACLLARSTLDNSSQFRSSDHLEECFRTQPSHPDFENRDWKPAKW